jgi:hypothetical protein
VALRSSRYHPRNDRGNHMRVMLSRSSLESVRTLKPVRAKNLQFPLTRILRSDDQHSPNPRPIRKHMLDNRNYIPRLLQVTRVLHLHDYRHMQSLRHQDGSPPITQLKQRRSVTVSPIVVLLKSASRSPDWI